MQFTHGARVFTASGQEVGRITHVVLDPIRKTVTHLVARKGWLFAEEKLIPFDLFLTANAEEVILRAGVGDLKHLPPFRETYYRTIEPAQAAAVDAPLFTGGWYLDPAAETTANESGWREFQYARSERENIPEGTVALKGGARVVDAEGQRIGHVESVLTRASTGHASHVVIVSGLLVKSRKILPTAWFRFIEANAVHLYGNATRLETLREY